MAEVSDDIDRGLVEEIPPSDPEVQRTISEIRTFLRSGEVEVAERRVTEALSRHPAHAGLKVAREVVRTLSGIPLAISNVALAVGSPALCPSELGAAAGVLQDAVRGTRCGSTSERFRAVQRLIRDRANRRTMAVKSLVAKELMRPGLRPQEIRALRIRAAALADCFADRDASPHARCASGAALAAAEALEAWVRARARCAGWLALGVVAALAVVLRFAFGEPGVPEAALLTASAATLGAGFAAGLLRRDRFRCRAWRAVGACETALGKLPSSPEAE